MMVIILQLLTFNINTDDVRINVNDSSAFAVGDRIVIDTEIMKVDAKPMQILLQSREDLVIELLRQNTLKMQKLIN